MWELSQKRLGKHAKCWAATTLRILLRFSIRLLAFPRSSPQSRYEQRGIFLNTKATFKKQSDAPKLVPSVSTIRDINSCQISDRREIIANYSLFVKIKKIISFLNHEGQNLHLFFLTRKFKRTAFTFEHPKLSASLFIYCYLCISLLFIFIYYLFSLTFYIHEYLLSVFVYQALIWAQI